MKFTLMRRWVNVPADGLAAFDWASLPAGAFVVDVGGGIGKSGRAIVESHPSVKVVVQDLPEVIEDAKKVSARATFLPPHH